MQESHPMLNRYVIPDMPSADELLPYLRQIDDKRWYSNFGPQVALFEQRLEHYLATKNNVAEHGIAALTLMSCYHALQIGLQVMHLPPKAKVLIPAVTFPACPLAVRHAHAEPVLADIDGSTWHLTPEIAKTIASQNQIHAVMPVAVYGVPVDAAAWDQFTSDTKIPVIIDAAAALEAQAIPKTTLVAHSMHATKPFSIGEGGVLVSHNRDLIHEARCISNFGTQHRIALQDGSNAKMSEYQAAVALAQLDRWQTVKQRRRDVFTRYRKAIEKANLGLQFQHGIEQAITSTLMLKGTGNRSSHIVNNMNARGIMAHRMYMPPLYHHPYFADLAVINQEGKALPGTASFEQKKTLMHNSEEMQQNTFGIPFHTFLSNADIAFTLQALAEAMQTPLHS